MSKNHRTIQLNMETTVYCPTCQTPHTAIFNGHQNLTCSFCRTEFSVLTKNGRVRSVSKMLRAKPNPKKTFSKRTPRNTNKTTFPYQEIILGGLAFVIAMVLFHWLGFGGIIGILLLGAIYYRFFRKQQQE